MCRSCSVRTQVKHFARRNETWFLPSGFSFAVKSIVQSRLTHAGVRNVAYQNSLLYIRHRRGLVCMLMIAGVVFPVVSSGGPLVVRPLLFTTTTKNKVRVSPWRSFAHKVNNSVNSINQSKTESIYLVVLLASSCLCTKRKLRLLFCLPTIENQSYALALFIVACCAPRAACRCSPWHLSGYVELGV